MSAQKTPTEGFTFTYEFVDRLAGDTIASVASVGSTPRGSGSNLVQAGTAAISGTRVLVFWEGGVDGEDYLTAVTVLTATGAELEATGTISVRTPGFVPVLPPSGYGDPTPAQLIARYPAFAAVDRGTIAYWIADSARGVDTTWLEQDYGPARLALAAHNMAKATVPGISTGDTTGMAKAGVTDFQSGSFRVRFSDDSVKKAQAGGFQSTVYGQDYADLLYANKGGPRVSNGGNAALVSRCISGFIPPW